MKQYLVLAMTCAAMAFSTGGSSASTLEDVKKRGYVVCGTSGSLPGFSSMDDKGVMQGIDADLCRAVAAAVFGDKKKVRFSTLSAKERFQALSSGKVDLLSRNSTHTLVRDTSLGVSFTYYNYIDGQGFMVRKSLGVKSALKLAGAKVCVGAGTTTELNLKDYFETNNIKVQTVLYDTVAQTQEGFDGGACDVLTSDRSQLASLRTSLSDPKSAIILPETISKEPLGPAVRQGDDQWANVVKWTLFALINAEEIGITSQNIDALRVNQKNPAIRRIVGTDDGGKMGKVLGLSADWSYQAIKAVGNYGEIYKRHIEPLGLRREGSVNDLWTRGGILYAPPIR